jgi:hypothetical protein
VAGTHCIIFGLLGFTVAAKGRNTRQILNSCPFLLLRSFYLFP